MRRGSSAPLLTAPRASLGRDMLRRLASNLGGVAARSGRGAFGAVPAVHAQQRSAGGLMVVRLPAPRCPIRAGGSRGSRGAASRTPSHGRSRHGVVMATRRARSRPGLRPTRPPRDRSRANPHDHFVTDAAARPVRVSALGVERRASSRRVFGSHKGFFCFREIRHRRSDHDSDRPSHVQQSFLSFLRTRSTATPPTTTTG